MPRIFHFFEEQATALGLVDKVLHISGDAAAENVVAEHDHHLVAVDEAFTQTQGFGDAARLGLIRKLQAMQTEFAAVAE